MSLLLSLLGFAVQLLIIASLGSIVTSIVSDSTVESATVNEEVPVTLVAIDATLPCASVVCDDSMIVAAYDDCIDASMTDADDHDPSKNSMTTYNYYNAMSVQQLKALCKKHHFKQYSKLRKHDLVLLLSESF